MPLQVTAIMIGVEDLARSKKFYGEGLGCTIDQDHPNFVSFDLGDGSSSLALYERRAPSSLRRPREGWPSHHAVHSRGEALADPQRSLNSVPLGPPSRQSIRSSATIADLGIPQQS